MEQTPISVVCFTGHRHIDPGDAAWLPPLLDRLIPALCRRGAVEFRTGGALGFDTLVALKLLELRERYPVIRLVLCLPCRDQAAGWTPGERAVYADILRAADAVHWEGERYFSGCMYQRNRRLVDGADVCVSYCTKETGGTAYTVGYALGRGAEIIDLSSVIRQVERGRAARGAEQ